MRVPRVTVASVRGLHRERLPVGQLRRRRGDDRPRGKRAVGVEEVGRAEDLGGELAVLELDPATFPAPAREHPRRPAAAGRWSDRSASFAFDRHGGPGLGRRVPQLGRPNRRGHVVEAGPLVPCVTSTCPSARIVALSWRRANAIPGTAAPGGRRLVQVDHLGGLGRRIASTHVQDLPRRVRSPPIPSSGRRRSGFPPWSTCPSPLTSR